VRAAGLPARLSRDAGTYLCNYGYWRALEQRSRVANPRLVVFVHVPDMRRRRRTSARAKSPNLDQLLRAAQSILIAAAAAAKQAAYQDRTEIIP
jgi:pyroglutamyl-peptidase